MLDQSFSEKSLLKLLRKADFHRHDLGKGRNETKAIISAIAQRIQHPGFSFSPFRVSSINGSQVFSAQRLEDQLAVRKLNNNIARLFTVKQADRHRILPQIKTLLQDDSSYWVRRLDIKSFYESIDRGRMLELLERDERLSSESLRIAKNLLEHPSFAQINGLPRGIALSATLAEIHLQSFDLAIKRTQEVFFYTRYVDDILILYHKKPKQTIEDLAAQLPTGLTFNLSKCEEVFHPNDAPINAAKHSVSYLGYEFSYITKRANKPSSLEVGIAPKKISKIKTRIMLALLDYSKTTDFHLLNLRIKFLTSNYRIASNGEQGNLYAGVYFNHKLVDKTREADFTNLDSFLRASILSKKGTLGKKLAGTLDNAQRRTLCKLSFKRGHEMSIVRNFSPEEMMRIKAAWRHT